MTNTTMSAKAPLPVQIKVVKSITCRNFKIKLVQLDSGGFSVQYAKDDGPVKMSEPVWDYKLAAFMFDMKLMELEGN